MRTTYTLLILIFLSSLHVSAQSIKVSDPLRRTHSIQTNLISLLRLQSAVNLQYQYHNYESRRGWIASIDVPFYLTKEPERLTYRYKSSVEFPSFDLKWLYTKNFRASSEAYVGIGFDYGFNQYQHRHTVCLDSELVNGTCICNSYDTNTFYSARHRAGMTLRIAFPLRFSPKFIGFLAFQTSFSYIFQPQIRDRVYNDQCGEIGNARPNTSSLERLTFNAHNPDFSGAQGHFHVELILPIKTFYR